MAEFDTGMPSARLIQEYIKAKQELEIKLLDGERLVGKVSWQDLYVLCLSDGGGQKTLVWRNALAYVRPTGAPAAE